MNVKDFTEGTTLTNQRLLILKSETKLTKQQKPYLKLDFADKTGDINGNLWDTTSEQINIFKAGTVISLNATVSSYQQRLQLEINQLTKSNDQNKEDLLPSAPEDFNALKQELAKYVLAIHNPVYQTIVQTTSTNFYDGQLLNPFTTISITACYFIPSAFYGN